jgi:recombination associated protein RdgC
LSRERNKSQEGPTVEECLEGVIFLDLWQEKMFLGQEFLTWLYLTSELNNHSFELPDGRLVEAFFENKLFLSYGQGQNKRSVAITTPEDPKSADWDEAYTAINNNKRITKGALRIKSDNREWRVTLPHDTLAPQSVKLSAVKEQGESDDLGKAGKFLERIGLAAELLDVIQGLFESFITLRLSSSWDTDEVPRLQKHLSTRK